MKTSIIIVTRNEWQLTSACLNSIRMNTVEPYEIIVVDNGSTDETLVEIKKQLDIIVSPNETNLGFAKACNQGVRLATGDSILFLNNDTVVTKHWLQNMLRLLNSDERIGIVGPLTNYAGDAQQIEVPYRKLAEVDVFADTYTSEHAGQSTRTCRLVGFCMLMRKKLLDEIGGFDERFGIGTYEDDDLCLRALLRGYHLMISHDAFVHHEGHATFRSEKSVNMNALMEENRQIANKKWGTDIYELLLHKDKEISPISISLGMIVRNEAETLSRCLESVRHIVDEIVIVDTGSTDATKSIAAAFTDRIFDFEWIDDFAAARNYAFDQATGEYVLWLDADDMLKPEDQFKMLAMKHSLDRSIDVVMLPYHIGFDEHGRVTVSVRRERLVKRSCGFRWHGPVHEYLEISGKIINGDAAVSHMREHGHSKRNLKIYERRADRGESFSPRDMLYFANELMDNGHYEKAIRYYLAFLDGKQGWIEDEITACGKLAEIYNRLGDPDKERRYTLKSFEYAPPRAEFCCRLGYQFMQSNRLDDALFWYTLATRLDQPQESWGFFNATCWTWLPHLQLSLCHYRLGNLEKAYEHNEKARAFNPNQEHILHNKRFYESIINPA